MELNPNHPTTQAVGEQWHKFCALLIMKTGSNHAVITPEDVERFLQSPLHNIVVKNGEAGDESIHLWLVDDREAERLAREGGGLPI